MYYSPIFSKTKKQIISLSQNLFFSKISKEGLNLPFSICNLVRQNDIFSPTKCIFSPAKCILVRQLYISHAKIRTVIFFYIFRSSLEKKLVISMFQTIGAHDLIQIYKFIAMSQHSILQWRLDCKLKFYY
jgi:hypothetical protein